MLFFRALARSETQSRLWLQPGLTDVAASTTNIRLRHNFLRGGVEIRDISILSLQKYDDGLILN